MLKSLFYVLWQYIIKIRNFTVKEVKCAKFSFGNVMGREELPHWLRIVAVLFNLYRD